MALTNYGLGPPQSIDLNANSDYGTVLTNNVLVIAPTVQTNPALDTNGPLPQEASIDIVIGTGGWQNTSSPGNLQAVILPSDDGTAFEYCYKTSTGAMLAPWWSDLWCFMPVDVVTYPAGSLLRLRFGWHTKPYFKTAIYNNALAGIPVTSITLKLWGAAAG